MYKCTECGNEYKIKPVYCDCGNDEFDEIKENIAENNQKEEEIPQIKKTTKKVKKPKKSFYEQYPQIENFVNSLDILSVIFFVVCLILSILIWIFAWNFEPSENKQEKTTTPTPITTEIPLIDNIWDSTPPKQKTIKKETETTPPPQKIETKTKQEEIKQPIIKIINKPKTAQTPKTTTKTQTAVKTENKKTTNTQKTKQETQTTKPPVKTEAPKTTAPTPKTQTPKTQTQTQTTTNNKELQNYKSALRQTLFKRLNIGSIEGNGECIISFSLSSEGKLLNRRFVRQSDNTSLNNAIYRMLMNTPYYVEPPATYKGETFALKFRYNNGYYEFGYVQ